ncbi:sensor histidine kinase [Anaeromicropila herbilytica]|uniref:histidine kinase n=1 Tax=Anaeromicropila herbilytica TaxID=2785025 RepID=A0A7R7IDF5_9FIRM|nr:sensor histidine kinase [Anaeromicropila herbilytica]BCN29963.1 histidine kinase [Anaeromicropila herbilytica]
MKERFHLNSLYVKILSTVVVGILCVSIAISGIVINISKNIFIDTYGKSQEKVFIQIEKNLNEFHSDLIQITNAIRSNWAFRLYLSNNNLKTKTASKTIYQMKKRLESAIPSSVQNISVLVVGVSGSSYLNQDEVLTTKPKYILLHEITKRAIMSKGAVRYEYLDHGFTSSTKYDRVIVATKALFSVKTGELYGVVYITIKEKDFEKIYDYFTMETNDMILFDNQEKVISSNQKALVGQKNHILYNYSSDLSKNNEIRTVMKYNNKMCTILAKDMPFFNGKLSAIIDNSKALKEMYNVPLIFAICTMISFFVLVIIFIIIQKSMKPLSTLTKKMSKVRNGRFDQHTVVDGTEEVRQLAMTFNYMLDDLNNYVNQLMKVQKEKRKAEIHALQMQINPHYIFNTLASIKWLIWQGNADKSVKILDSFISLLRNTISNTDEFITVSQEVENLKNYCYINNTRYGDKISVEYYIQHGCENYLLPKLILQPFIENAFFHAFPNEQRGIIQVFIQEVGENLRFEIKDNGVGMDEEQLMLQREKRKVKTEHFTGIGINNVDDRIKLIYGTEYGIHIVSQMHQGTTVTIELPKKQL